jgi:hypothetical protein
MISASGMTSVIRYAAINAPNGVPDKNGLALYRLSRGKPCIEY